MKLILRQTCGVVLAASTLYTIGKFVGRVFVKVAAEEAK